VSIISKEIDKCYTLADYAGVFAVAFGFRIEIYKIGKDRKKSAIDTYFIDRLLF
jgi:hypothetical protein